jgi:branched-chain amino acid transport system substrate-binding protein
MHDKEVLSKMKKIIALVFMALLPLSFLMAGGQEEETIKVGAIFSITGPSFLGIPEQRTAEMLVEEINGAGGIDGREIELIVKDSGGNPEKALSFAKQLIEEDQVFAIIGPSTSGETLAIKDLMEETGTILVSCAAAETIVNPVARYVFKTPQKDSYAAQKIFETMREKEISKIGVVVANSGFGNAGKAQLEKFAPDFGIEIVIAEVYDRAATDLTAVLTKLKARGVEAVVNWSIVDAQSIIPKNMKQLGMEVPLFQSHGFGNIKYVEVAGQAAEGIIFPAGRLLIAETLPNSHPQKSVLVKYKEDYESRFGEDASTFGGHAWDALMILVKAIEEAGFDKEKVRTAIENMRGFVGTGGIFNFSPGDHNGLGIDSFEMLTVKNGKFAQYKN